MNPKNLGFLLILLAAASLGGCALAALAGGKGKQKALYELPKDKKVLVFVDDRPASPAALAFMQQLSTRVENHLFKYKAAYKTPGHFVDSMRVTELRHDPAAFAKMKVSDIAKAVGADVVLVVDIWKFDMRVSTDGEVNELAVQTFVKVVDKDGNRLWPAGDNPGHAVDTQIDPAFASDRDTDAAYDELTKLLSTRIGRMFHDYSLEDSELTR